jgi:ubiquinone/menaquinone biosynthesis C-methylase UbiE
LDYDTLAADYARHRRVHPGVVDRLIETGRIGGTSRVLEVGCGSGNYLLLLRELTGCAAWGLDPSAEMLAQARARPGAAEVTWHEGRAEDPPFPEAAFDLIFSVDVIHHVADRPASFRAARRLLAPGGRLCTATDSAEDIARRRPLSSHWPETVPVELARYPAIETLREELTAAGFAATVPEHVELTYDLGNAAPYRARAFSSLHLIPGEAFARGLARLEADLAAGPLPSLSLYTLIWAS